MEKNVLVVAAHIQVRKQLRDALRQQGWQVTMCGSGSEALRLCDSISVDVALLDTQVADTTPAKLRGKILERRPRCQVVMFSNLGRTLLSPDLLKCGRDHLILQETQLVGLLGHGGRAEEDSSIPSFEQLGNEALLRTIDVLVGLLELDEQYFSGNSHQVAQLAKAVGKRLLQEPRAVDELRLAALLRDIGRGGLPEPILRTDGEFDESQAELMQEHVSTSVRLLDHIEYPWRMLPIVQHHHERYDGSGYPDGLRGREIPLGARILAVVDAFVAMTSPRNHRAAKSPDEALDELMLQSGHQFDPEVVEVLQGVLAERMTLREKRPSVLLVDDDERFTRLFKHLLIREGFDAATAGTTEEAMRQILQNAPNVVVCQVDRDVETSFAFLTELRSSEDYHALPVLLVTKKNDRELRLRAFRAGVDDLLARDANLEDLVARVRNVVVREAVRRDGSIQRERTGITGTLENLSLPDIVQMLVVGMKTACVTLDHAEQKGRIWFESGALVAAECGKRKGENAFYELVTWMKGGFLIEHGLRGKRHNLKGDPMFLLMEGLRRLDESGTQTAAS